MNAIRIKESTSANRKSQIYIRTSQHHLTPSLNAFQRGLLFFAYIIPKCNGVFLVRVARAENEILVFGKTHFRILSIGFGGIQRRHPFENAFTAAFHLGRDDLSHRLPTPLQFLGGNSGQFAGIGFRMNPNPRLKLLIREFQESGHIIQLRIARVRQIQHLFAGERNQRLRNASFFQNQTVQFSYQRLSSRRSLDKHPVSRLNTGGMFHKDFCKTMNSNIHVHTPS